MYFFFFNFAHLYPLRTPRGRFFFRLCFPAAPGVGRPYSGCLCSNSSVCMLLRVLVVNVHISGRAQRVPKKERSNGICCCRSGLYFVLLVPVTLPHRRRLSTFSDMKTCRYDLLYPHIIYIHIFRHENRYIRSFISTYTKYHTITCISLFLFILFSNSAYRSYLPPPHPYSIPSALRPSLLLFDE